MNPASGTREVDSHYWPAQGCPLGRIPTFPPASLLSYAPGTRLHLRPRATRCNSLQRTATRRFASPRYIMSPRIIGVCTIGCVILPRVQPCATTYAHVANVSNRAAFPLFFQVRRGINLIETLKVIQLVSVKLLAPFLFISFFFPGGTGKMIRFLDTFQRS